jgi:crossover junction endodeoxyribonuclease RuvC
MSNILALDAALNHTGYCIFKDGAVYDAGVYTVPPKLDLTQKLTAIFNKVTDIIRDQAIDVVVLEGCYTARNAKTAYYLSTVHGAIMTAAGREGVKAVTLPPSIVKKTCCGVGNATKQQVAAAVLARYKDVAAYAKGRHADDVTDAAAVGHAYLVLYGRGAVEHAAEG